MGHFSMEKPPNPGSVLGGNQHPSATDGLAGLVEHRSAAGCAVTVGVSFLRRRLRFRNSSKIPPAGRRWQEMAGI